jgi:hypothetical protein
MVMYCGGDSAITPFLPSIPAGIFREIARAPCWQQVALLPGQVLAATTNPVPFVIQQHLEELLAIHWSTFTGVMLRPVREIAIVGIVVDQVSQK